MVFEKDIMHHASTFTWLKISNLYPRKLLLRHDGNMLLVTSFRVRGALQKTSGISATYNLVTRIRLP